MHNDFVHKRANHFIRYLDAISILFSKSKKLFCTIRISLNFIQLGLIRRKTPVQFSFFLFISIRQLIKAIFCDSPESIVLIELFQKMLQLSDSLFFQSDLL